MTSQPPEHTGLLRMGLDVVGSLVYWERAQPGEGGGCRRQRAEAENWFPGQSVARLRYRLLELERRFPDAVLPLLQAWTPDPDLEAPVLCHWHLQCSDPGYLEFSTVFLVSCWAQPSRSLDVGAVQRWLEQRPRYHHWSATTRRRLASGLLAAAQDAGLVSGSGREKSLRVLPISQGCADYLQRLSQLQPSLDLPPKNLLLSGTDRSSSED